ncbi:hypothetical protein KCU65_g7815, partial [Aureobasidium melanogenum]
MARTRSQSREPSVEPHLVHRQARNVAEGTARNARQAQQQLEPLSEGPSEIGDDDGRQQSAASEDEDGGVSDHDSAPIDTFSQTELQRLDPVRMENNLEELNTQARKLLSCFKARTGNPNELQSLVRELEDPESRQRQKADGCQTALEQTQAIYTEGGTYLVLGTILRALLRKRSQQPLPKAPGPWRPDDVICKANLAIFAYNIMTKSDHASLMDALESVDSEGSFPSNFVVGLTKRGDGVQAGYSALLEATFEFALDVRTQILVGMLDNENPTLNAAAEMIQNVMLTSVEDDDDMGPMQSLQAASHSRHARGWRLLDPLDKEIDDYADKIIQRTEEIKRLLFSDIENPFDAPLANLESGLVKLRERFSCERFKTRFLQWSNLRLSEIDESIRKLGGIDDIIDALEDEVRRRLEHPDAYTHEDQPEQEIQPSIESNFIATRANVPSVPISSTKIPARPSVLFRGRPGTSTAAPTPATAREEPTTNTAQNDIQVDDDVMSSAALTDNRPRLTGRLARANAIDEQERQKRRLFIDAQPGGVRLVDDLLDLQPSLDTLEQASARHEIEIDPTLDGDVQDPSEDEGFQTDQRTHASHRPRPTSSAAPSRAPVPTGSTQSGRRRRTPEPESPNKRQRKNPGQLREPFRSTGDDVIDSHNMANALTKQYQAENRTIKAPKGRRPWENDEVKALLELIRDNGPSWSMIKRIDEARGNSQVLEHRSAEDMRFKARDMKVLYLVAKRQLPENLDMVALGKKEIEKLKKNKIHYEQEPQRSRAYIPEISPRSSPGRTSPEL